jgi:cytochrome c oxidase assembly protein subunit 15
VTSDLQPLTLGSSRWPHRLAIVLCCATFPLVWVGGLVTSYKAGMAFPDWPTSDGYFLFFYPWLDWLRGPWDLFVEHGHRLLASCVGVLTIAFCCAVFLTKQPKWLRVMGVIAVLGVVLQGVLGGVRVLSNNTTWAMVHGCTGPAFFAFTAALVVVTSRPRRHLDESLRDSRMRIMTIALPVLAYAQIILGAQVRHFSSEGSPLVYQGLVWFHIVVGVTLTAYILWTAINIARAARRSWSLMMPASILVMLVIAQLGLGAATWIYKYNFPAFMGGSDAASAFTVHAMDWRQAQIATAHVATGSLILAVSAVLALRTARLVCAPKDEPRRTQRFAGDVHRLFRAEAVV